jgi:hypothetical protein
VQSPSGNSAINAEAGRDAGFDRAFLLLLDGARADVFERLRAAGELPNLERYVIAPGGAATATAVFPSLTNVGYASIVTGAHPGRHDVPAGAWLDRGRYARWRPSPFRFRQYWGMGHFWHDADLSRSVQTLFERLAPSRNIFGVVGRGTGVRRNAFLLKRIPWALTYLRTGDWAPYDRACAQRLLKRATTRGSFSARGCRSTSTRIWTAPSRPGCWRAIAGSIGWSASSRAGWRWTAAWSARSSWWRATTATSRSRRVSTSIWCRGWKRRASAR